MCEQQQPCFARCHDIYTYCRYTHEHDKSLPMRLSLSCCVQSDFFLHIWLHLKAASQSVLCGRSHLINPTSKLTSANLPGFLKRRMSLCAAVSPLLECGRGSLSTITSVHYTVHLPHSLYTNAFSISGSPLKTHTQRSAVTSIGDMPRERGTE